MRIAFSRNNDLIGSFLIRWGTAEGFLELTPVSHFLVIFDEKYVLHSNLSHGVNIVSLEEFLKKNEIVKSFKLKDEITLENEESIYQALVQRIVGKTYDMAGMAYITWRVFLKKFFDKPLPPDNPWNLNDSFFCVETFSEFNQVLSEKCGIQLYLALETSIIDPYTLMLKLEQNDLVDVC